MNLNAVKRQSDEMIKARHGGQKAMERARGPVAQLGETSVEFPL